jgi:hypothetical protein
MAQCEVCGNNYDKSFEVRHRVLRTCSTVSSVQFTRWRRRARTANAESLGTGSRRGVFSIVVRTARRSRVFQAWTIACSCPSILDVSMSTEDSKKLIRDLVDAHGRRDIARVREILSPGLIWHSGGAER